MTQWQTKGRGRKILSVQDPATNRAERAVMDKALEMHRLGISKQQSAKDAGKGQQSRGSKGKGKGRPEHPKWTCSFCFDTNLSYHQWCNAANCGMRWDDAAHREEEAMTGSTQSKGKGKGKDDSKRKGKGGAWSKGDGAKPVPPEAEELKDQPVETQLEALAQATAKNLMFSGISPAPQVEKLKPYPKPAQKADEAGMGSAAEDKVQKLETALEEAVKNGTPANILEMYRKEITTAKTEQAKPTKDTKEISWEALQRRITNAESAAAGALERHQAHVTALDGQITQLQKIREHRVLDFGASQKAFATRLLEDQLLAQKMAAASAAPQAVPQTATVSEGIATALTDLQRHYAAVASEFPACPTDQDQTKVEAMGSLWHFYSAVGSSPWAPLVVPAVTFDTLQVSPSFVHTLVGDAVWEGYWVETHNVVQGSQYIPTTMHNVLKHILEEKHQELSLMATAKETALVRFEAAKAAQAQRKIDGDPF